MRDYQGKICTSYLLNCSYALGLLCVILLESLDRRLGKWPEVFLHPWNPTVVPPHRAPDLWPQLLPFRLHVPNLFWEHKWSSVGAGSSQLTTSRHPTKTRDFRSNFRNLLSYHLILRLKVLIRSLCGASSHVFPGVIGWISVSFLHLLLCLWCEAGWSKPKEFKVYCWFSFLSSEAFPVEQILCGCVPERNRWQI